MLKSVKIPIVLAENIPTLLSDILLCIDDTAIVVELSGIEASHSRYMSSKRPKIKYVLWDFFDRQREAFASYYKEIPEDTSQDSLIAMLKIATRDIKGILLSIQ